MPEVRAVCAAGGSEEQAAAVRKDIRAMARADDVRIRTARIDDSIVAVRVDAELWNENTATMRRKLKPR